MQVVDFPAMPPSVCFVCEDVPRWGRFVDTHYNFDPPGLTPINGRKYVCEGCVQTFASLLGWLPRANAELMEEDLIAARETIAELEAGLADMESLAEIANRLAPKPKSGSRNKAA